MPLYDLMYLVPKEEYRDLKSTKTEHVQLLDSIKGDVNGGQVNHIEIGEGGRVVIKPDNLSASSAKKKKTKTTSNTPSQWPKTKKPYVTSDGEEENAEEGGEGSQVGFNDSFPESRGTSPMPDTPPELNDSTHGPITPSTRTIGQQATPASRSVGQQVSPSTFSRGQQTEERSTPAVTSQGQQTDGENFPFSIFRFPEESYAAEDVEGQEGVEEEEEEEQEEEKEDNQSGNTSLASINASENIKTPSPLHANYGRTKRLDFISSMKLYRAAEQRKKEVAWQQKKRRQILLNQMRQKMKTLTPPGDAEPSSDFTEHFLNFDGNADASPTSSAPPASAAFIPLPADSDSELEEAEEEARENVLQDNDSASSSSSFGENVLNRDASDSTSTDDASRRVSTENRREEHGVTDDGNTSETDRDASYQKRRNASRFAEEDEENEAEERRTKLAARANFTGEKKTMLSRAMSRKMKEMGAKGLKSFTSPVARKVVVKAPAEDAIPQMQDIVRERLDVLNGRRKRKYSEGEIAETPSEIPEKRRVVSVKTKINTKSLKTKGKKTPSRKRKKAEDEASDVEVPVKRKVPLLLKKKKKKPLAKETEEASTINVLT